ncbi:MAG: putative glycoside hydrolase, partial [Oscillospiraceae bacterium]
TSVARQIKEMGMVPVARVHAFRDDMATHFNRGLAVGYFDTGTMWLDNAPELGGRAWLNPYSSQARQYVTDLAVELTRAGFGAVVLDSVQFPSGVGLNKTGYGTEAVGTHAEVLSAFLRTTESAVQAAGGEALLYLHADSIASSEQNWLYGGMPTALAGQRAMLGVPFDTPVDQVGSVMSSAVSQTSETDWILLCPAYSADGTVPALGEVNSRLEAAKQAGAVGSLLYNPQGNYRLN